MSGGFGVATGVHRSLDEVEHHVLDAVQVRGDRACGTDLRRVAVCLFEVAAT